MAVSRVLPEKKERHIMEIEKSWQKRIEDLAMRCERRGIITSTGFLTMAEQTQVSTWAKHHTGTILHMDGGDAFCERKVAFFLPEYEEDPFDVSHYIRAVKATAYFGQPSHRDYMGATLALGIRREWIGDFRVLGNCAYIYCLPSVESVLREELNQAGRVSLKTEPVPLESVPEPDRKRKKMSFTVKSPRLDAVAGGMFGISRSTAAELIRAGAACLNDEPCVRTDAPIQEGDVISIHGKGKGTVKSLGGRSRKDRLFLETELYL